MQVMYILGRLLTCCQCSFQADNRLTYTHVKNNMAIRRILVQKIKIQVIGLSDASVPTADPIKESRVYLCVL